MDHLCSQPASPLLEKLPLPPPAPSTPGLLGEVQAGSGFAHLAHSSPVSRDTLCAPWGTRRGQAKLSLHSPHSAAHRPKVCVFLRRAVEPRSPRGGHKCLNACAPGRRRGEPGPRPARTLRVRIPALSLGRSQLLDSPKCFGPRVPLRREMKKQLTCFVMESMRRT